MAKPTGFLEYERALGADRDAVSRIADWDEFHGPSAPEEELRRQAARCMDCGTPFCHSGIVYDGAASGCPVNNLVPEWNDLAYRGLWREALARLLLTNDFPEFTGRVCPAPCEGACTMGSMGLPAVTIKQDELEIIDRAWREGWMVPEPPARRTGKKVAVVGSGPAGLACADQLNRAGHEVVVYERADKPGGLLTYGIPNMKLDKAVVARRLDLMAAEGVRFVAGTEIGVDLSGAELRAAHDAVVLAGGATRPRDLDAEGRSLSGVLFAVDFLTASTKRLLDLRASARAGASASATASASAKAATGPEAKGKDVLVIGGGDTGADCVGTALRQGCKSVTQIEIMPRPPAARAPDNPWPRWPRLFKTDYAHEEAAALFGKDPRVFLATVKAFHGGADGAVEAATIVDVEWTKDGKGRPTPRERAGTERKIPVQLALVAMGFLGPDPKLLSAFGVEADARGNAKTSGGRYATSERGVFAAGDLRRGQSLVVWAIDEGRRAALEVDAFLSSGKD